MKTKIDKKLDWLNLHCENRFSITVSNCGKKFNIRDAWGNFESTNLSKFLLNKKLDNLENLLSNGYFN